MLLQHQAACAHPGRMEPVIPFTPQDSSDASVWCVSTGSCSGVQLYTLAASRTCSSNSRPSSCYTILPPTALASGTSHMTVYM